jgi:hypothetical protein
LRLYGSPQLHQPKPERFAALHATSVFVCSNLDENHVELREPS